MHRGSEVSNLIERTLEDAISERLAVLASAYLFGSVPEGRAHRESDVDVGVLLEWASHPTRAERFEAGIRLAGRLQAAVGRPVDLVVLNDAPPLLGRHVVTRGRRILCRDPEADHAYVRDVQLRAADLEPWLRRMRELKLRAIRE
jgi:predicted nucleotidyltransferase